MDLSKNLSAELKQKIDSMSHLELARKWRHAPAGEEMLSGDAGDYFKERLFEYFGGFTPEISKRIGW